jgi:hypothetical protein
MQMLVNFFLTASAFKLKSKSVLCNLQPAHIHTLMQPDIEHGERRLLIWKFASSLLIKIILPQNVPCSMFDDSGCKNILLSASA